MDYKTGCFILHRVGPGREYERLYGPYMEYAKACGKLREYVEHFVHENECFAPQVFFIKDEYAKVFLNGFTGQGAKDTFFFAVKSVGR